MLTVDIVDIKKSGKQSYVCVCVYLLRDTYIHTESQTHTHIHTLKNGLKDYIPYKWLPSLVGQGRVGGLA